MSIRILFTSVYKNNVNYCCQQIYLIELSVYPAGADMDERLFPRNNASYLRMLHTPYPHGML